MKWEHNQSAAASVNTTAGRGRNILAVQRGLMIKTYTEQAETCGFLK